MIEGLYLLPGVKDSQRLCTRWICELCDLTPLQAPERGSSTSLSDLLVAHRGLCSDKSEQGYP